MAQVQNQASLSREEVIDILQSLEERYPVETWYVDDVPVWPIVKIKLFFEWFRTYKKQFSEVSIGEPVKEKKSVTGKLTQIVAGAGIYAKLKMSSPEPSAFLFTGAAVHRAVFEGRFINKFFSPLLEYIFKKTGERPASVEYGKRLEGKVYPVDYPILFLTDLSPFLKLLRWKRKREITRKLEGLDTRAFIADIQLSLRSKLSEKKFAQTISEEIFSIDVYADFYSMLFKKYGCRYTLGLWYYHVSGYGMNLAAFRNGVVSVDVQHGSQGPTHVAYANFKKIPAQGYSILPKHFWVWEQGSADVVDAWAKKSDYHSALVGGNPWLDFLKAKPLTMPWLQSSKPVILYTLQHTFLEPYIIDAIRKTGSRFFWLLRLHPRELHNKGKLEQVLTAEGLASFADIENATKEPLPLLMPKCSVHLSKYSGSIIEAALLNVPNVILDELGVQNYRDLINDGQAVACTDMNADTLIAAIDDSLNVSSRRARVTGHEVVNYETVINEWLKDAQIKNNV